MPQNQFPDSTEKQALRRRDAIFLEGFRSQTLARGLRYCGLTSAEFRDIQAWSANLREAAKGRTVSTWPVR
jgi:hypothetical protein